MWKDVKRYIKKRIINMEKRKLLVIIDVILFFSILVLIFLLSLTKGGLKLLVEPSYLKLAIGENRTVYLYALNPTPIEYNVDYIEVEAMHYDDNGNEILRQHGIIDNELAKSRGRELTTKIPPKSKTKLFFFIYGKAGPGKLVERFTLVTKEGVNSSVIFTLE
jgi:hypothetical protein